MKLIFTDGKWFIVTPGRLSPLKNVVESALNKTPQKYVLGEHDEKSTFSVLSMEGDGLKKHFSFHIANLAEPEVGQAFIFFEIFDNELADKLRKFLGSVEPPLKIFSTPETELTKELINKLISFFQK